MSTVSLDTNQIRSWRSIITLIVFVGTNIIVLCPFHVPIFIPRPLSNCALDALSTLRIISPRHDRFRDDELEKHAEDDHANGKAKLFVRFGFPVNFVTAPLIADLFLLAISAIGRKEVYEGTIGANNISPIDIMAFFLTLAYIAISIDASGLIRYLAFVVLQKGGKVGHKLFFFLYLFFFGLGTFIGNDPIILSGTAFLAYMTRVSSNIVHPRAWIHSQFAVANIASAILVSSNPTNLVLAGAFKIRFITYTANMIVPVVVTAVIMFPFLLYIIFADESLIPFSIKMHELSEEAKNKRAVNPNIPNARGLAEEEEDDLANSEQVKRLSLEEIMNPFLDRKGALFGAIIMATTLITVLVLNAVDQKIGAHPVFWVTLPAAVVMLCWDILSGWFNRHETRELARKGREEIQRARAERALKEEAEAMRVTAEHDEQESPSPLEARLPGQRGDSSADHERGGAVATQHSEREAEMSLRRPQPFPARDMQGDTVLRDEEKKRPFSEEITGDFKLQRENERPTLVSLLRKAYSWSQETFPTVTAVFAHLPFALVPFAFCMFILVQALVTKGWVPVFAYGWDHWVNKTGTVGSIGGMGFLSVILCNFAGTNIGTTILLSRVIQAWEQIHRNNGTAISKRTFWATVYSMALGVNYGAFSTAFSASLAGLLWRDILARKHIHIRSLDFARVNLPIIAIAMAVGCTVLVGEVYITRDTSPFDLMSA